MLQSILLVTHIVLIITTVILVATIIRYELKKRKFTKNERTAKISKSKRDH